MTSNKFVRVDMLDGKSIKIPRLGIDKIVIPSANINNKYGRLVLDKKACAWR